jgi:putative phosphoribosyl transferase
MSPQSRWYPAGSGPLFADRQAAGAQLAAAILKLKLDPDFNIDPDFIDPDFRVYALPKGGLPVAVPVAKALSCGLDVIVAKKITRPENPEFALGAVTADGHQIWTPGENGGQHSATLLNSALQQAQTQSAAFMAHHPQESPRDKIAVVIDDGIATGMTMAVAVAAIRDQHPRQVWIATPVAPVEVLPLLEKLGDRVIVLATPSPFYSVSRFYHAFPQLTMAEAIACLSGFGDNEE